MKALCRLSLLTRRATNPARHSERHIVVYGVFSNLQTRHYLWRYEQARGRALSLLVRSVGCLTAGPQPLTKRVPNTARSSASYFNYQDPLFSLVSSSSFLRLLPHLPATCILPSIFPSIACFILYYMICYI